MANINLERWQQMFLSGKFDDPNRKVQIDAGWYDWFCKDSSLAGKTKRIGQIIKQIKKGGKVDLANSYVWFKNNCPLEGPLYDDFRFADMKTASTLMTIQVNCCWNKKRYTVFGRKTANDEFNRDTPLFESDSSRDLVKWLNTAWEDANGI